MIRTRTQKFWFGLMMVSVMVYGMEVYNALWIGKGWTSFVVPISEYLIIGIAAFAVQFAVGGPFAHWASKNLFQYQTRNWGEIQLKNQVAPWYYMPLFTVMIMCPIMSLIATLYFVPNLTSVWTIQEQWSINFVRNLPMAYFWQFMVAGPIVRFVYKRTFA